ncbi:MAG: pentapeptide repeat-containing protein [Mogibacterium sp.]|nr:pentapeptide repeat-containing protein [Mogibacterium sp.]
MNFTSSERDYIEENEAYVPISESEKRRVRSTETLFALMKSAGTEAVGTEETKSDTATVGIETAKSNALAVAATTVESGLPDMRHCIFSDLDLRGRDMRGLDLSRSTFENCDLRGTDFSGSKMDNVAFYNNKLMGMKLCGCKARGCSFRFQDMTDIDLRGANIYASVLEDAINQDKVIVDDETEWYRMRCPEEGEAFVAWKCCTDLRVVMMLVPRDAKRCMATMETGRAERVKVLKITNIDETENFTWAQSTVDPDFYYEVGKWLEPANGFQEDRWKDSSPGIHFFLDRQQCVDYQSK